MIAVCWCPIITWREIADTLDVAKLIYVASWWDEKKVVDVRIATLAHKHHVKTLCYILVNSKNKYLNILQN